MCRWIHVVNLAGLVPTFSANRIFFFSSPYSIYRLKIEFFDESSYTIMSESGIRKDF